MTDSECEFGVFSELLYQEKLFLCAFSFTGSSTALYKVVAVHCHCGNIELFVSSTESTTGK